MKRKMIATITCVASSIGMITPVCAADISELEILNIEENTESDTEKPKTEAEWDKAYNEIKSYLNERIAALDKFKANYQTESKHVKIFLLEGMRSDLLKLIELSDTEEGGISVGVSSTNDRRGDISGHINLQKPYYLGAERIPLNITYNFDDMPSIKDILNGIKSDEMDSIVNELIDNDAIRVFSVAEDILEIDTMDNLESAQVTDLVCAIESVASGNAVVRKEGKYTFITYKVRKGTSTESSTLKNAKSADYMNVTLRVNENQKSILDTILSKDDSKPVDEYEVIRNTVKANLETLKVNKNTNQEDIYLHIIQNIDMFGEYPNLTTSTGHWIAVHINKNYDNTNNKVTGYIMFIDKEGNENIYERIDFEKEYTVEDNSGSEGDKDDNAGSNPDPKPENPGNTEETDDEKLERIYQEVINQVSTNLDKLDSFDLNADTKRADILRYVTDGIKMINKDISHSTEGLYTVEGNIYVNVVSFNDRNGNIEVQVDFRKDENSGFYVIGDKKYKYEPAEYYDKELYGRLTQELREKVIENVKTLSVNKDTTAEQLLNQLVSGIKMSKSNLALDKNGIEIYIRSFEHNDFGVRAIVNFIEPDETYSLSSTIELKAGYNGKISTSCGVNVDPEVDKPGSSEEGDSSNDGSGNDNSSDSENNSGSGSGNNSSGGSGSGSSSGGGSGSISGGGSSSGGGSGSSSGGGSSSGSGSGSTSGSGNSSGSGSDSSSGDGSSSVSDNLNNTESSTDASTGNSSGESSGTVSDSGEVKVQTWIKNEDGTWKLNVDGKEATGWQNVNGSWYLFDNSNVMKTGWQKVNDTWYHLSNSGAMTQGWLKDANEKWYYLNSDGTMKSGWHKDTDGKWYYLHNSGEMKTGWIKDANEKWYYLNKDGAMKTGWLKDSDGRWYYLKDNGEMAVNETIGGYYINNNGVWIN